MKAVKAVRTLPPARTLFAMLRIKTIKSVTGRGSVFAELLSLLMLLVLLATEGSAYVTISEKTYSPS